MIYQPRQRIALVFTNDPYTRLRPGDTGTVVEHNVDLQSVDIDWDNGSNLAMCLDAGDRIALAAVDSRATDRSGHPDAGPDAAVPPPHASSSGPVGPATGDAGT